MVTSTFRQARCIAPLSDHGQSGGREDTSTPLSVLSATEEKSIEATGDY